VAITGIGLVTPLGRGVAANWDAMLAGRSGVREEGESNKPAWMRWVGRVEPLGSDEEVPAPLLPQFRFLNRGARFGFAAASEAVLQAAIPAAVPPARRALVVATGDHSKVGYDFLFPATRAATGGRWREVDREKLNRTSLERVNPLFLLESLNNNPFSFLAAAFGYMGAGTSLASQSPSGSLAVDLAYRSVRAGRADVALAVGCGSWVNEVPLFELAELGLLSRARQGAASYRPFDRHRDGFLAGEGGAAVVLEGMDHARRRGAVVLAAIEGVGSCAAAGARSATADRATLRAMELALADARRSAQALGFVLPHGSGTRKGDGAELASLAALLGDHAPRVPVCGLKPYTGHMGAASDVGEVVLGVSAASGRTVPATPNFRAAETGFAELSIAPSPQPCAHASFLTLSYGFGGQASALVVSASDGACG
jgi:3-oxoacyl-[acyl-carrier-protein] synthase II